MRMVFLQPRLFFRMQREATSQHWLLAALIILVLVSASAIRQQQFASGLDSVPAVEGASPDTSLTWKPALTASSQMILNWISLSAILIIVSLSQSIRPRFDQNLRVVIWASMPFGLMAALQLLYYSSGGHPGNPGLSGLINDLPSFQALPSTLQMLVQSFSAQLTIFWLWNLILLYLGARYTLGGMRVMIALVLGLWVAWLVLLPLGVASFNSGSGDPLPTLVPFSEATQSP
jgi:hypothetical protein